MPKAIINNVEIEWQDAEHMDFMLDDRKPQLYNISPEEMVELAKNPTEEFFDTIHLLSRWVFEAPRKRVYRSMIRKGQHVLSTEYFFEQDGGGEILDALARTGDLAADILTAWGKEPMKRVQHDDPSNPIPIHKMPKRNS